MKKLIVILVVILLILGLAVFLAARYFYGGFAGVKLTYWGLWEPEVVYNTTVIADYQKLHPNVTIEYKQNSPINYGDRLKANLSDPNSPPVDIFRFHNSWVPMLHKYMSTVPDTVYSLTEFTNTFYPVARHDLYFNEQLYGIPLEVDTLALYVNKEIFSQAGISYPRTWPAEFTDVARKLTVYSGGRIDRTGVAMGNAGNVTHWQDILGLAFSQNDVNINSPTGSLATDVLDFYTNFQNGLGIWDGTMEEAKIAFSKGKAAMYFGYSWDYFDIKAINPNLQIVVIPAPQLPGKNVNYASYWVEGVSKNSKHQKEAWEFLRFISSKEQMAKLYEAQAKLRGFGEPYSRVDMASLLQTDPIVSVFINQAKTAKSGLLSSLTRDGETGINTRVGNYYAQAINSSRYSGDFNEALVTVSSGISQVLADYGFRP